MVRSLAVVGVLVALFFLFSEQGGPEPVKVIDYTGTLERARQQAPYRVLAPEGLAAEWRATSARVEAPAPGVTTWHVGFVTPQDEYAGVEQSDGPSADFVAEQTSGAQRAGTQEVAGTTWERWAGGSRDRRALVRRIGGVTVVVTGSASYGELAELAGALR